MRPRPSLSISSPTSSPQETIMAPPTPPSAYHGSLVAFEGSADLISTQLRLLPTSPQILILPALHSYLPASDPSADDDASFDAAAYVRRVHDAAAARAAAATTFLDAATRDSKRLVFLHGGTPSAYALCAAALARHETRGDRRAAESLLRELTRSGVAGIMSTPAAAAAATAPPSSRNRHGLALDESALFSATLQDPITRAMRAADALDEKTASLQPDTDLDLTRRPQHRPRSSSLPVYGYIDDLGDAAPFYVFGAGAAEEEEEKEVEEDRWEGTQGWSFYLTSPRLEASCFYDDRDEVGPPPEPQCTPPPTPRSPRCVGEAYHRRPTAHPGAPPAPPLSPLSPHAVVFGEASVVRMSREIPRRSLKRARSLDRVTAERARYRDFPLRLPSSRRPPDGTSGGGGREAELEALRRFSCVDVAHEAAATSPRRPSVFASPKTVFVRPAARRGAAPPVRTSYVDRGTDAWGDGGGHAAAVAERAFEPALPFTEDLVLYFRDGRPDPLLESLVESFRTGTLPAPPPPTAQESPGTPLREASPDRTAHHHHPTPPSTEPDSAPAALPDDDDDYDPFAYDKQPSWTAGPTTAPPTPARTPPPPPTPEPRGGRDRIRDFDASGCHTAVTLQNALRSVLERHFPSENSGFDTFSFRHLPELDGLWRPIFGGAGGGARAGGGGGWTVDQVIAVGAQAGVRKEFVTGVSRRLEALGEEATGASRSGRLDFRYLIANAMQAFTAQPLAKQTRENPFANPYLLATLVIPHLETYLAAHSEVRLLLLEYPADHLPTVLAIQRLVGLDLVKVAQIVDPASAAGPPLPFAHIRGSSPIRSITTAAAAAATANASSHPAAPPPAPRVGSCDAPVTRANFLLASTATDAEIGAFVGTVSDILAEISPVYRPPPPRSARSPRPPSSEYRVGGHGTPLSRSPTRTQTRSAGTRSARSDDVTPPSTSASNFVPATPPWREAETGRAVPDFQVEDDDDECDDLSDLDVELGFEEKRLMPIFMKRERRVGSHKALRFLGLA